MIFILGILIGVCLCSFLILLEIWLSNRYVGLNKLRQTIKQQIRPREAQILKPLTQQEKDVEKIIKENERKGISTPIEDIFKG